MKIRTNGQGHLTKMMAMSICGKNLGSRTTKKSSDLDFLINQAKKKKLGVCTVCLEKSGYAVGDTDMKIYTGNASK